MWELAVILPAVFLGLFSLISIAKSIYLVREKEVIIIERFGKFSRILTAGVHCIVPYVERPKTYYERYHVTESNGRTRLIQKNNQYKINTQEEVLDFPKQ